MALANIVPWIVAWSGELADLSVRPCKYMFGRVGTWAPDRRGDGQPQFDTIHPVRERQAIREKRCYGCGRRVVPRDRYYLPLGRWIISGEEHRFSVPPPMHRECVDQALKLCPHLRRAGLNAMHADPRTSIGVHPSVAPDGSETTRLVLSVDAAVGRAWKGAN
jgi:hypothetical protein